MSPAGEIRRDEGCLDYPGSISDIEQDQKLKFLHCHGSKGNQEWFYDEVESISTNEFKFDEDFALIFRNNTLFMQQQNCA